MDNIDSTPEAQQEPSQPVKDSTKEESIQLNDTSTRPVKLQRMPPEPSKLTSRPITQPDKGRGSQLDPKLYESVVKALISGETNIRTSQRYGISQSTVEYIRQRPEVKEQIPSRQSLLIDKSRTISNLATQRLQEALEEGTINPDKLPVAWGIALTKEQEVSGNTPAPSSVHQHLHISHESVSKILEALPVGPVNSAAD